MKNHHNSAILTAHYIIWTHVCSPVWYCSISNTFTTLTQSTVQPVPTRHRRHACIKMQTALSGNTRTWTNVVSILVKRRWWGGGNIETALGQILVFAGLQTGVCLHPPLPSIIFSPADQGTFSKTASQSQAYSNTWNWEWGTYDVTHLQILTCEIAVSRASSVTTLWLTSHRSLNKISNLSNDCMYFQLVKSDSDYGATVSHTF